MRDRTIANGRAHDARPGPMSEPSPAWPAPKRGSYLANRLFHIPPYWRYIGWSMASAAVPALISARALPGPVVGLSAAAAIAIGLLAPAFVRLEREKARYAWQRALVMLTAVGLPMLLYGWAAAGWAREQNHEIWIGAVGMVALAAATASILLARRPSAMLTALTAVWLPLVVGSSAWEVRLIFAMGVVGGAFMVWRQTHVYHDAMARRQKRQLAQERAFAILVDYEMMGHGWFWEIDADGRIVYLSANLGEAFGCPVEDLHGRLFVDLFGQEVTGHESAAAGLNFFFSARTGFRDVLVCVAGDGEERWWSVSGSPIQDGLGGYFGFRGFGWDQTEKRRSQERSSRMAHYDSLTGTANRLQMSQSLETILNAPHEQFRRCAILLIDLDRFKQVNDTLGHPAGDDVLKQVAERLREVIDGTGRVGRLGGDEFQVILPGAANRRALSALAECIVESLSQPYELDGQRAAIGASVGIALAPDDGVTSDALIRNADLALYAAKDAGRACYRFYAPDLHSDAEERRQLEQDLREAVASGGLELWYQPVVHTLTETIVGFEGLLRWTHPRLGPLSPARFVPIAEEAGLIAQIGEWALRTACSDLAKWPESLRVAVNLSPLQFANSALPAIVTSALASAQVAPSRLELEITESVFLSEDSSTEAMFAALKRIGVRLALDDFGTGYSSLGYLEAAPFDRIKLDREFLRGAIEPGSRNGAILASIVGLAEALGMESTAEGVETPEELELARILGCSHVQGFVYEAPMSLQDTVSRLARGLEANAGGARTLRSPRSASLRQVVIEIGGERHDAVVCDVAIGGATVEVSTRLSPGTAIAVHVGEGEVVPATVRWCDEGRLGVEFAAPLTVATPRRVEAWGIASAWIGEPQEIRRVG